jgi:glutathione S-transferase
MSEVIIRGFPQSSYVMTARFVAGEKGVDHEFVPLAPGDDSLSTHHPYKKVPSLKHGDVELYETAAITRYLDEAFEGPALQPGTPADRGLQNQFISVVNCYLYPNAVPRYILQYIFPKGADGTPDRAAIDAAVVAIDHDLGVLNAAYGDSPFLVGGAFSLADAFVAPLYAGIARFPEGEALLGKYPKVAAALGALAGREAFQKSLPG